MTVHLENNHVLLPRQLLSQCAGGRLLSRAPCYKILALQTSPRTECRIFLVFPIPAFLKGETKYRLSARCLVSKILFSRIRKQQDKGSLYIFNLFCSVHLLHTSLILSCFFAGCMPPLLARNAWATKTESVASECNYCQHGQAPARWNFVKCLDTCLSL